MNEKYLKILEFDKIKGILSTYAISENAKDKIEKLEPSTRREVIELLLEQTSEAQKIIFTKGAIPFGSIYDVRLQAKKASIGSILDAKSLIKVKEIPSIWMVLPECVSRLHRATFLHFV